MSQAATNETAQRRLNILRFGLMAVTAVAFALATALSYLSSLPTPDIVRALLQGLLWGAVVAIASAIVYAVYRRAVLKM